MAAFIQCLVLTATTAFSQTETEPNPLEHVVMGQLSPYWEIMSTVEHGASVSSPSKGIPGFDIRSIIDPMRFPGPEKTGTFIFADIPQREEFTVDFGRVWTNVRVTVNTVSGDAPVHGDPDKRLVRQMKIYGSVTGKPGSWNLLRESQFNPVPRRQSVIFDTQPVRYIRFDLGENTDGIGSRMGPVRLYRRYPLPSIHDRLKQLLDLLREEVPGLKPFRDAVAAGNDDAAVAALRAHFAKAPVKIWEGHDGLIEKAENLLKGRYPLKQWSYEFPVGKFDWYIYPCDVPSGPPAFWVAGEFFWHFPELYYRTHDPKHAKLTADLIRDWLQNFPCPGVQTHPGTGGRDCPLGWHILNSANRTAGLARALMVFAPAREDFDDFTWIHTLYSLWEHAEMLAHVAPVLGGNWLTWINKRLLECAAWFPEFRARDKWLQLTKELFERVVRQDVFEDGKEREDSSYYCLRAMGEILFMYTIYREAGIPVASDLEERIQRALDFPAWIHIPDFRNPGIGDMGGVGTPQDAIRLVDDYAEKWGRQDLVYINTRGKAGRKPDQTSRAFLPSGWFILRSDWDDGLDARHLLFRSPPKNSRGHGHRDVLGITLYAYNQWLLIDPGMTGYGVPGSGEYSRTDRHNCLTIDETTQPYGGGKVNKWKTTSTYALADAQHSLYPGITHRRRVLFARPDYYVLIDDLTGEGEHTWDLRYLFLKEARPTDLHPGHGMRTNFPTGGNLAILTVPNGPINESNTIDFTYVRNRKLFADPEVPSKGWRFRGSGPLPVRIVTLLYPFKGALLPANLDIQSQQTDTSTVIQIQAATRRDNLAIRNIGLTGPWKPPFEGFAEPVTEGVVFRSGG